MKNTMSEDSILVFTRMPAEGFDDFMSDPEAVIATVEDMGFDQEEILQSMTVGDPGQLIQLMEGRWSGEQMNFAFENLWGDLLEKFPDHDVLKMLTDEGRNSQIHTEYGEVRVLSIDQVAKAHKLLSDMPMIVAVPGDEKDSMLEDLFPALQRFFTLASEADEFVLVSRI